MTTFVQVVTEEQTPNIMDTSDQFAPTVDYLPNPHFVFPMQPAPTANTPSYTPRRPMSLQISPNPSPRHSASRKSVSTLPTFTFNASDTSGLADGYTASASAGQISPTTPSKAMRHRRGASEFVGGNSRFGVPDLISTSPAKNPEMHPTPFDTTPFSGSPAKRKGHAHRRSAAVSGHDLPSILGLDQGEMSLPPTLPLNVFVGDAEPPKVNDLSLDTSSTFEGAAARVIVRPRVGFSENIEIIPRPLSTISSEGGSSTSTPTGHSVTNSISSVINFSAASPTPASRRARSSLIPTAETDPSSDRRSSVEISKELEMEGYWFKGDESTPSLKPAAFSQKSSVDETRMPGLHARKNPLFNLDRRSSEPSLSLCVPPQPQMSSLSLQEPVESHIQVDASYVKGLGNAMQRKSSIKKVKAWASAIIRRKEKDTPRPKSMVLPAKSNMQSLDWLKPTLDATPTQKAHVAEPDLDELFSQDPFSQSDDTSDLDFTSPRMDLENFSGFSPSTSAIRDSDDTSPVLDLDAVLGSPSASWENRGFGASGRRQLHSARTNRDFAGSSNVYYHRRAESAPALAPFDFGGRSSSPSQSPMADVFEEEEDEADDEELANAEEALRSGSYVGQDDDLGVGIEVVDIASEHGRWGLDDGLGIQRGARIASGSSQYGMGAHLSTPSPGRRPSSIVDEIIIEETSPVEIVEDHEEPRASSLTKSSDSSDTPTILADNSGVVLVLPPTQSLLMTPTTYAASTFSSPDFARRQGSFDTSRVGTSASSMTDSRTMSSFAAETGPDVRMSVDDVPSLTSSRSTMISTSHQGGSRRNFSDRSTSIASVKATADDVSERRRKRSSIQSLSKFVGAPFGDSKSKLATDQRPQIASARSTSKDKTKKKEHRLSRLMFWKHKDPPTHTTVAK